MQDKQQSQEEKDLEQLKQLKEKELDRLTATAREGEEMEGWIKAHYEFLNEKVFKPLEWDAFMAQKHPSFNVEDKNQAHQQVALLRAIDIIRKKLEKIVEEGINARSKIRSYSTQQKEGE